ncbi:hypothetical protein ACNKHT_10485 [Shigella flexneri]
MIAQSRRRSRYCPSQKHANWNSNRLMGTEEQVNPRKATIEAAIARAKARNWTSND